MTSQCSTHVPRSSLLIGFLIFRTVLLYLQSTFSPTKGKDIIKPGFLVLFGFFILLFEWKAHFVLQTFIAFHPAGTIFSRAVLCTQISFTEYNSLLAKFQKYVENTTYNITTTTSNATSHRTASRNLLMTPPSSWGSLKARSAQVSRGQPCIPQHRPLHPTGFALPCLS